MPFRHAVLLTLNFSSAVFFLDSSPVVRVSFSFSPFFPRCFDGFGFSFLTLFWPYFRGRKFSPRLILVCPQASILPCFFYTAFYGHRLVVCPLYPAVHTASVLLCLARLGLCVCAHYCALALCSLLMFFYWVFYAFFTASFSFITCLNRLRA